MAEDRNDPYEATARWLEEAARRRPAPAAPQPQPTAPTPARPQPKVKLLGIAREVYMLGLLAAAYLNFYFMQVMLEIDSLPKLVVFYPVLQWTKTS
jgi:hypothetical protein